MIEIAKIAINGSNITVSTKEGHVTYDIEIWHEPYCASHDEDGFCTDWVEGYWESNGSGSTGAKITGTVTATSNKFKVNGKAAAIMGDKTNETWEASPPVPSSNSSTRYTPTSDTSGSGQGSITGGNDKHVKLNGQLVAAVGSQVTTCLGNTTTIYDGENSMNM